MRRVGELWRQAMLGTYAWVEAGCMMPFLGIEVALGSLYARKLLCCEAREIYIRLSLLLLVNGIFNIRARKPECTLTKKGLRRLW